MTKHEYEGAQIAGDLALVPSLGPHLMVGFPVVARCSCGWWGRAPTRSLARTAHLVHVADARDRRRRIASMLAELDGATPPVRLVVRMPTIEEAARGVGPRVA